MNFIEQNVTSEQWSGTTSRNTYNIRIHLLHFIEQYVTEQWSGTRAVIHTMLRYICYIWMGYVYTMHILLSFFRSDSFMASQYE